jgi:hypothetical protein
MTCSMRVTKLKAPTKTKKNLHDIGRISSRYHGKKAKYPMGISKCLTSEKLP